MRSVRSASSAAFVVLLSSIFATGVVGAAVSKGPLKSEALSISNFPAGWSVNNTADTGDQGCVSALRNPGNHVTKVTVRFSDGNAPDLEEVLMSGSGASKTYAKLSKTLSRCKSYTATNSGQTATVHVGAMSFPQVGQASSAYSMTLTVQGVNLGADLILFRSGRTFGAVEYEDLGTPDINQAQAYVAEAVNKVEGKPTTTPTTF
jgi:hypothetical protein